MSDIYKDAGVDLHAGYDVIRRIAPLAASTARRGSMGGIGAFGALFDIGSLPYRHPVLVSGADGVGTKIKLALSLNKPFNVGIDAVAMCVNDILTYGAEPLFFLDCISMGSLNPGTAQQLVAGMAHGCKVAGCSLAGGETAELPAMLPEDVVDVTGFAVGVVEKENIIDNSRISPKNIIIALPSSGIHSNGFSLVRKIISEKSLNLGKIYSELDPSSTLGDILLSPTHIYVKQILALLREVPVNGIAHITGGGFKENIPRIIPQGLEAVISTREIKVPPVFSFIESYGGIPRMEMFGIFNMGVGMVLVVDPRYLSDAMHILSENGPSPYVIGEIQKSETGEKLRWIQE